MARSFSLRMLKPKGGSVGSANWREKIAKRQKTGWIFCSQRWSDLKPTSTRANPSSKGFKIAAANTSIEWIIIGVLIVLPISNPNRNPNPLPHIN
mmetsp:Transcript_1268/g.2035  ORF Transcript_1268/g.2035 Transcript_1268/m.2035 type:complete len:95 (-) Transcript_1268:936-1220(-)